MGSSQSTQAGDDDDEQSEEEEEEEEGDEDEDAAHQDRLPVVQADTALLRKVLEQEPEMLPCYASASPLSPQLSSLGTPRLGPSIKVWDPYNVLSPPPLLPAAFDFDRPPDVGDASEVFLVSHGESELGLRPDLVRGRCHVAGLTNNGRRQARALAVLLNSQGVRFDKVYSSPLDRARSMALSVCQDMNFPAEQIHSSDALLEMSFGQWEGCPRAEIYTHEVLGLIESLQPDFSAPSGESLRQVEFRMLQFLNETILGLPEKLRLDFSAHSHNESPAFSHDRDGPSVPPPPPLDMLHRHRQVLTKKKSCKSRLQFVTSTGNHDGEDEISPREESGVRSSSSSVSCCIGIFTHSIPIKCLLTGLLGCSPVMSRRICIEDSSVTVIHHSWKTGWQIKRLNDTAHLRLL